MNKKYLLPFLFLATILTLSACSGKLKPLAQEYVTAEPQPLVTIGGQVPVTINATFPAKWFNKKAVVTVTPVIRYAGGETWGTSSTFQGEKVRGNNIAIPYKDGANVTMLSSFPYIPAMKKSELYLTFTAQIKNKVVILPDLKIADGVLSTSELIDAAGFNGAIAADKFQRIIQEAYDADIMFLIQQANLRPTELKKDAVTEWKEIIKNADEAPNQNVAIEISAYASPDGGFKLNNTLSENREKNTKTYINSELKKMKVADVPVDAKYTAQDWEGFKELVSASNLQDKDLILRVINMYNDPETREQEIKKISQVYLELANTILPRLRRSRLTANIEIIGKSDEEIAALANSNPSALNVDELLYSATLTDDVSLKTKIYGEATKLHPQDYRTWNNAGVMYFKQGEMTKAMQNFEKANSVQTNPTTNVNLGVMALMDKNLNKANLLFGTGAGVDELGEATGILNVEQGEYQKAASNFQNVNTNNAALAFILTNNYSKALQILNAVPVPNGMTYYLKAIVAARTNDTNGVLSNLKTAISMNSELAQEASIDLEFVKYWNNSDFQALTK